MKRPQSVHVTVYRPNRNGKRVKHWLLRYRSPHTGRLTEKTSGTSDRQGAQRLAVQLETHLARQQDPLNVPRVRIDAWFEPKRFGDRLRRGLNRREHTVRLHVHRGVQFVRWTTKQNLILSGRTETRSHRVLSCRRTVPWDRTGICKTGVGKCEAGI